MFSAPAAGVSQRDVTQRFPQLQGQEAELSRHILGFFTHHVQHKFPSKDCKLFTYGAIIDVPCQHAKCRCWVLRSGAGISSTEWHSGRAAPACTVYLLAAILVCPSSQPEPLKGAVYRAVTLHDLTAFKARLLVSWHPCSLPRHLASLPACRHDGCVCGHQRHREAHGLQPSWGLNSPTAV